MMRFSGHRALALGGFVVAVTGLSGCATDEPYTSPFYNFADTYMWAASQAAPVPLANDSWWQDFSDPVLNALVGKALAGNINLAIARETVIEAHADLNAVPTPFNLGPSASVRREKEPGAASETTKRAGVNLSWALDPYGLRRQQIKAASARVDVADAEVDAARLSVLLNMANAYVDLRYYQRLLSLRGQQLKSRRRAAALTKRLFDQGAALRLDVVQTEALVAETQAQIPPLVAAAQSRRNEIAVLAGAAPGQLDIDLDTRPRQPRPQTAARTGIPSDLIRNRPDLRIAERSYYAAVAEIGVARAELYPMLSLGGMIGYASSGGTEGMEYFFGPSITFPSLPLGNTKARLAARHSRAKQAHDRWTVTVLEALRDVEDAQSAYRGSASAVAGAQRSARLHREARDLTVDLLERDAATIRELISAEEKIADADSALADALRQLSLNYVRLNIGLGAGSRVGAEAPGAVEMAESG